MPYTKDEAKIEIQKLVNKFEEVIKSSKTEEYEEEDVKVGFILQLFESLNWTTTDFSQMKSESKVLHRKRVDHAFKIRGVTKFLVESKKFGEVVNDDEAIEQAYNYGYNIGVRWVVLTNFQKFLFIDCFVKHKSQAISLILDYDTYIERIDDLWLFNREGFLKPKSDLEEWADRYRPYLKRKEVAELIFDELINWRKKLTDNINSHSRKNKLVQEELDEAVQTILDRLIFIRTCEDKGFENQQLRPILNKWEESKSKKLIEYLNELFRDFDGRYNSELFTPPKYTDLFIDDYILEKIIKGLYFNQDNTAIFDFSLINVDVLGNIYEEYLEYLLKVGKKATLKRKHQHRKDFGQFYTPTYIVDFIVKNTILEKIKEKNDLKILDCACGSGSFLIKAFDTLKRYYEENNIKIEDKQILKNSIYGVDIDKKACEIANLNLIFKILKQQERLPKLVDNIKCGNSLIEGKKEELKKYFKNIEEKKPFNWEEEFEDIFNEGKFDVIIGNPPYVEARSIPQDEVDYFRQNYKTSGNRINTFTLFIEKAINLLKEGGLLGMIIHKNSIRSNDYIKMRKFILDTCKIVKVIMLGAGIFKGVTGEMVILILQKNKDKNERLTNIVLHGDIKALSNQEYIYNKINQKIFYEIPDNRINVYLNNEKIKILEKTKKNSIPLNRIADTKQGIIVGNEKKYIKDKQISKKYKPILRGRDIDRYKLEFKKKYLYYVAGTKVLKRGKTPDLFEKKEKIVTQHVSGRIKGTLDTEEYYTLQTINLVYSIKKDYPNKYLLALLNSKLLNFYYDCYFNMGSEFTTAVATENLNVLPIKLGDKKDEIIFLVDKILNLNKELLKEKNQYSTKYLKLKEEIEKIDEKIDYMVYDLYSISKEEKEIIEKNLK